MQDRSMHSGEPYPAARPRVLAAFLERHGFGRVSKGLFLVAAGLSFLMSVSLWFLGNKEQGLFVGLWVPSILSLGALLMAGKGDLDE